MKKLRSIEVPTEFASGAQKLGHPVPLLYFAADEKSDCPQAAHTKVP
jgi:hypothetical protein